MGEVNRYGEIVNDFFHVLGDNLSNIATHRLESDTRNGRVKMRNAWKEFSKGFQYSLLLSATVLAVQELVFESDWVVLVTSIHHRQLFPRVIETWISLVIDICLLLISTMAEAVNVKRRTVQWWGRFSVPVVND